MAKKKEPTGKPKGAAEGKPTDKPKGSRPVMSLEKLKEMQERMRLDADKEYRAIGGEERPLDPKEMENIAVPGTIMSNLGEHMINATSAALPEGNNFRKRVEKGAFGLPPTPHKAYEGAMEELKAYLHMEGRMNAFMQGIGRIGEGVYQGLITYLSDIESLRPPKFVFENINKAAGSVADKWELVAEERLDEEGAPKEGRSHKYKIEMNMGNGSKPQSNAAAFWCAVSFINELNEMKREYSIVLKARRLSKAKQRVEKIIDKDESTPSIVFDLKDMDMGRVSGQIKIQGRNEEVSNLRKTAIKGKLEKIALAMAAEGGWKGSVKRAGKAFVANQKRVDEKGRMFEPYVDKIYEFITLDDRMTSLIDRLFGDRERPTKYQFLDLLADTIIDLRTQIESWTGIDEPLTDLLAGAEKFAKKWRLQEGIAEPDGDMMTGGGEQAYLLRACGERILKIMQDMTAKAEEGETLDAVTEKARADGLYLELENTRGHVFMREKQLGDEPTSGMRFGVKDYLDDMSDQLESLYTEFGKSFKVPPARYKDPLHDSTSDTLGSMKRFRRLMENMCIMFNAMETEGRELNEPGRYMMGRVGEILGMEFDDVSDMRGYVEKEVKGYVNKEKIMENVLMQERALYKDITGDQEGD